MQLRCGHLRLRAALPCTLASRTVVACGCLQGVIPLPLVLAPQDLRQGQPPAAALAGALHHLVTACPGGTDCLVEALARHIHSCTARLTSAQQQTGASSSGSGGGGSSGDAGSRAAARAVIQAWALVVPWVVQGSWPANKQALTRLAELAQMLTCLPTDGCCSAGAGGSELDVAATGGSTADYAATASGAPSVASSWYEPLAGGQHQQEPHVCSGQAFLLGQLGVAQVRRWPRTAHTTTPGLETAPPTHRAAAALLRSGTHAQQPARASSADVCPVPRRMHGAQHAMEPPAAPLVRCSAWRKLCPATPWHPSWVATS